MPRKARARVPSSMRKKGVIYEKTYENGNPVYYEAEPLPKKYLKEQPFAIGGRSAQLKKINRRNRSLLDELDKK